MKTAISTSTRKTTGISRVTSLFSLFVISLACGLGIFSPETLRAHSVRINKLTGTPVDDLNDLSQYMEKSNGSYKAVALLPNQVEVLGNASYWTLVYGCVNVRSFGFVKVLTLFGTMLNIPFSFASGLTGTPITTPITVTPIIALMNGIYVRLFGWIQSGTKVKLSESVKTVVEKYPYFTEVKNEITPENMLTFISELRNGICVVGNSETVEFHNTTPVNQNLS